MTATYFSSLETLADTATPSGTWWLAVARALDELDEKFRDPVMMCDVEGMDYAAIAAALDIPINTVRTRISRGRQYIADRIQEQFRSGGSLA